MFTEQDLAGRKYILFDYDGTLADTKASIVDTAVTVLREFGMSDEEIGDASRLIGPPFPEAYELVYGLSRDDAWKVTQAYREIYFNLPPETFPFFDGIPELLEQLTQAGYHLAIASSKLEKLVVDMLEATGVRDYFEVISAQPFQGEHVTKGQLVARALKEFNISNTQAIMVGDLPSDIQGGIDNALPAIGVYFGGTAKPGQLETAGATACAHSVKELRQLLTK